MLEEKQLSAIALDGCPTISNQSFNYTIRNRPSSTYSSALAVIPEGPEFDLKWDRE